MSKIIFKGNSLEECIKKACKDLNLEKEDLTYTIIKDSKGLFKKKVTIEVEYKECKEDKTKEKEIPKNKNNELDGTVEIKDGEIFVADPKNGGSPAIIIPEKNINFFVDGEECNLKKEVYEKNIIKVEFDENEAKRNLSIKTSENSMKAYISITYIPKKIYTLQDSEKSNKVELKSILKKQIYPPKYTKDEIKEELSKNGIKHGIIENNLEKCTKNNENIDKLLIAKGEPAIDDTDDVIDMKIDTNHGTKNFIEEKNGRIDFKSIGFVNSVSKGDILAIKHEGKTGKDGINIHGNVVRHKKGKKINIKAGEGCKIDEKGTIISIKEGKPSVKGNTFYVYSVHEIKGDVDLSTGNIKFVGDVIIPGSVKEGMKVEAGNSIEINRNVEMATIIAKGDIVIKQNVIGSDIIAGGEDVSKLGLIKSLENMENQIISLIKNVEQIKEFNLLGDNISDGQIIKGLIETKFKKIPKTYEDILHKVDIDGGSEQRNLVYLIKDKLIGISPINIKDYKEINDILINIQDNIRILKTSLSIPVNVDIFYCQDCSIKSSGDIVISGKGDYVSDLTANNNVYFTQSSSIVRGGVIRAKNEIKCKIVGSPAGVVTKLIVEEEGHIWVDYAYQNTLFVIGKKQYSLTVSSKDVHAYLDENLDIKVDKFVSEGVK